MVYTRRFFIAVFFLGMLFRSSSDPGPFGIWQLQGWPIWGTGLLGWMACSWMINRKKA